MRNTTYAYNNKQYKLSNHLENVLVTSSDLRKGANNNADGIADYYNAIVTTATDYYAFGSLMPARQFNSTEYTWGFNVKEMDNGISDNGNQYDYGFRIYNPRLGKFLTVDPLTKDYPELTTYQFASNTPIQAIDIDGLEAWVVIKSYYDGQKEPVIEVVFDEDLVPVPGVYTITKNYTLADQGGYALNSVSYGEANYTEFPNLFSNFANGNFDKFSFEKLASSVYYTGEANILFAEVAGKIKFLGAEVGGSFGANGKLIGININSNDRGGKFRYWGWQSSFRKNSMELEVGGGFSLGGGASYRHKFDLNSGTFKKENIMEFNGIVTSAKINGYDNTKATLNAGTGGKFALGFGVEGDFKVNFDPEKFRESLQPLLIRYTPYEQKLLNPKKVGTKKFDFTNY